MRLLSKAASKLGGPVEPSCLPFSGFGSGAIFFQS
jgi:hypothetical protein